MKKLILTLTVLLSFTGLSAQDRAAMDSLQNIIDRAGEALVKKNYPTAACLYNEAITFANEHPDEAITPWRKKNTSAHCQYNLACIYSLTGKKQAALNAFKQALDAGYSNYKWALEDKDLKNIQGESYFKELIRPLAEKYDYAAILKKGGKYSKSAKDAELPAFTYLEVNDPRLVHLRETLNLDSIAGHGDEISRIKNLCLWVHNTVRHDGSSANPEQKNALALIRICKEQNRGVNCRMLATILNECYLAMGFKSRFVTCLPKSEDDPDCHVVNVVWSRTLDKWIMADPSFYAFFTDKKGNLLGIAEARQMILDGKTVKTNPEINWNGQPRGEAEHIDYMTKNFYWFSCPARSTVDTESVDNRQNEDYLILAAGDFKPWQNDYITRDADVFWARPE